MEDAALLYVLSDPNVIQQITAQHIIMRPRQEMIRVFVPRRFVNTSLERSDDQNRSAWSDGALP